MKISTPTWILAGTIALCSACSSESGGAGGGTGTAGGGEDDGGGGAGGAGDAACVATYDPKCGSTPTVNTWTCGDAVYELQCQRNSDDPDPSYNCSCSENGAQTGSINVSSLDCGPADILTANAGCNWDIE